MSLPPNDIRHRVIEELQRRGTFRPLGYVACMTGCVILLSHLPKVTELIERFGLDWTYKWFTQSSWNRQELYAFYLFFVLVPIGYMVAGIVILSRRLLSIIFRRVSQLGSKE